MEKMLNLKETLAKVNCETKQQKKDQLIADTQAKNEIKDYLTRNYNRELENYTKISIIHPYTLVLEFTSFTLYELINHPIPLYSTASLCVIDTRLLLANAIHELSEESGKQFELSMDAKDNYTLEITAQD